jgi:hypothetical protein
MSQRSTPLQVWLNALYDVLSDAREALGDEEYAAFIFIATERVAREAGKLAIDEARRAADEGGGS